jgi:hypothetical protein
MAGNSVVYSHRQVVQVGGPQVNINTAFTATHLIPVTSFSAEEVVTPLIDNGRRGPHALDFRQPAGVKLVNITIEGVVQSDPGAGVGTGVGKFLRNIMGGIDTITTTSYGIWNHDFQLPANPAIEYLTIETDNQHSVDASNRTFVGCRVQEMVFSFNAGEGMLTWTATLTGASVVSKGPATLTAQAATIEDGLAGWEAGAAFDSAINYETSPFTKLISAEWTLSRAASVLYTAQNTQVANQIMLGPLAATVALVMDFDNTAEIAKYRAASEVKITNAFVRNRTSSTTALRRFIIGNSTFSIIDSPVTVDISGEHATIAISARALYNTDASVIIDDTSVNNDANMAANTGPIQVRISDLKTAAY